MAEQADELLKNLIRRAAGKSVDAREAAIKLGILSAPMDEVEWSNYTSRHNFLARLGKGEIDPPAERFEKASDETLLDWAKQYQPEVLPSALSTVMCVLSARITESIADNPRKALVTFGALITTNADRPGPLAALMPACILLGGKAKLRKRDAQVTWAQLVEKVEGINNATLNMAFHELVRQRDAAKAEKARQTREANKAAGIVAHDKFIDILSTNDLEKVMAYELGKFDQKRFDRVREAWFQARPGIQMALLKCPPALWAPYKLELLRALIAEDRLRRADVHMTVDTNLWERLTDDERLATLERMFEDEIHLVAWPSIAEVEALLVALHLMEDKREGLFEQLRLWVAVRKITTMSGKERDWDSVSWESQQAERFESVLGLRGKMLHVACNNSDPTELVPVLEVLPEAERQPAAQVVAQFYLFRHPYKIFIKWDEKK